MPSNCKNMHELPGDEKDSATHIAISLNHQFEKTTSTLQVNFKTSKCQPQNSEKTGVPQHPHHRRRFKRTTPQILRAISPAPPRNHHFHSRHRSNSPRPPAASAPVRRRSVHFAERVERTWIAWITGRSNVACDTQQNHLRM